MAVLRRAERRDHDAVLRLWDRCGLDPTSEDEWLALVTSAHNLILVAQERDDVVGTVIATFDGWRAYIYHLAVAPEYRRSGLGLELMEAGEAQLRQRGARRAFIAVHEQNTAGLALAAMAGYLPEGDIVLEKTIAPE